MIWKLSSNHKREETLFAIPEILISDRHLTETKSRRYAESVSPLFQGGHDFLKLIISPRYFKGIFLFLAFAILIFLGRGAYLQIILTKRFAATAERNKIRLVKIFPERGLITDRQGVVLADNSPQFIITLTPADMPLGDERKKVIDKISAFIGLSPLEIEEKISPDRKNASPYDRVILSDDIAYDQALLLKIDSASIPGLNVDLGTQRNYSSEKISSQVFSHLAGYVSRLTGDEYEKYKETYSFDDVIGRTGIESSFENLLKGKNGRRKIEVNALGKETNVVAEEKAKAGKDIILSIDAELQAKTYEALNNQLRQLHLGAAAAIVLNPQKGEILSMVSLPAYDNAKFVSHLSSQDYQALMDDVNRPLFNRALAGEYPSGSTIKPILAAAALNEKIISSQTGFLSTGGLRVGQWFFPDWKVGGHGWTDVRKALADSVNTFFYTIGGGYQNFVGLGLDKIVHYAKLCGFGDKTSIELPGERSGFLPTAQWKEDKVGEVWYIGDTYHLSIGQGYLTVTPLQVADEYAIFANGGTLYQPTLLLGVKNADGSIDKQAPKIIRQNIFSQSAIETVRAGLRDAVTYGSARSLNSLPLPAAGKTGTAQWQTGKNPHAWFAGFFPYDQPQIVVVVLIEAGGEGSSVSVPVAKEIMQWWYENRIHN